MAKQTFNMQIKRCEMWHSMEKNINSQERWKKTRSEGNMSMEMFLKNKLNR